MSGGEGGLQQARQPSHSRRRSRRPRPDQLELLTAAEEDGEELVVQARTGPLIAAHAANQGSPRGGDLMPDF